MPEMPSEVFSPQKPLITITESITKPTLPTSTTSLREPNGKIGHWTTSLWGIFCLISDAKIKKSSIMLLNIGTTHSIGTAWLLNKMSQLAPLRTQLLQNGVAFRSVCKTSAPKPSPISVQAGPGLPSKATTSPSSTPQTLATHWQPTTNLSWQLTSGNMLTTLTTETLELSIWKTSPSLSTGNSLKETSQLIKSPLSYDLFDALI
jgi:hypothetical protein